MNNINVEFINGNTYINGAEEFEIAKTLDCGQAFRWRQTDNNIWCGVAFGKYLKLSQNGSTIVLYDTDKEDYYAIWKNYFDIDRNYSAVVKSISCNKILKNACECGKGIRILKQDHWETLCSFIISQNNNIPRIKGIIERLCQNFGDKISEDTYTFPDISVIASLSVDDLNPIRCGFRARYIIDAAKKVVSGEVNFEKLYSASLDSAEKELMKITGVGLKVADCVLLYGFGRIDAFPKDVWINRAMDKLFNGVLPECALPFAGIVQQYIFYYARSTKLEI